MDLTSVIGLIAGVAFILIGMFLGGELSQFLDYPSIMIVIGASFGTFLITNPWEKVKIFFSVIKNVFFTQKFDIEGIIPVIVSFAEKARREGLLVLEDDIEQLDDEFLKKGIQLVVDGTDPELVKNIMTTQMENISERHSAGAAMCANIATLAPAFGMIGTLIGLIIMLGQMDDPETIGPSMSIALITTLYGSLIANLIFIPMGYKLKTKSEKEMLLKEIMVEGMLSIQSGDNPRIVEEKLRAFLPPSIKIGTEKEGE